MQSSLLRFEIGCYTHTPQIQRKREGEKKTGGKWLRNFILYGNRYIFYLNTLRYQSCNLHS